MRLIKALGAAVILATLLVAVPIGLVIYPGNPWPAEGVSMSAPLTDGAIIGLLAVLIWVLWVQFVLCVVTEAIAVATRDRVQIRVPFAMGISRSLARKLVGAVVVAAVSTPLAAGVANAATGQDAGHSAGQSVSTQTGEVAPATSLTLVSSQRAQAGQDDTKQAPEQATEKSSVKESAEKGGTNTVTVQRFDSLWSIAERTLGDGERWSEIADLNQGHTMADGTKFDPSGPIQPGWKLLVPGQAGDPGETGSGERVIEPGDTLSAIAAEELGDANAYPKLFDASKGTVQPGGQHLTDPDLIQPGWTVTIPGQDAPDAAESDKAEQKSEQKPAEVAPESDGAGEEAPGDAQDGASQEGAEQGSGPEGEQAMPPASPPVTSQAPAEDAPETQPEAEESQAENGASEGAETAAPDAAADETTDETAVDEAEESAWLVRTVGGVCVLLAGAVIALIARRRIKQRRSRKPGQKTPLPSADAELVEQEIRAVADEPALDGVDAALRTLVADLDKAGTPRPQLRLARLTTEQIDLYFTDAVSLPAPWRSTEEPSVWVLPTAVAAGMTPPAGVAAPWPGLVTVGHDVEDGMVLVDLAQAGSFGVVGESPYVDEMLTAMAFEVGTAPWSTTVDAITVGGLDELGQVLEPSRVRYVPTVAGSENELGLIDQFANAPVDDRVHLVIDVAGNLSREDHDTLRECGVTVVTNGWYADEAAAKVSSADEARLLPFGLKFTPQLVDERTYAGLVEVLETSLEEPGEHVLPFDAVPPNTEPPDTDSTLVETGAEASTTVNPVVYVESTTATDISSSSTEGDVPFSSSASSSVWDAPTVTTGGGFALLESVKAGNQSLVSSTEVDQIEEVAQRVGHEDYELSADSVVRSATDEDRAEMRTMLSAGEQGAYDVQASAGHETPDEHEERVRFAAETDEAVARLSANPEALEDYQAEAQDLAETDVETTSDDEDELEDELLVADYDAAKAEDDGERISLEEVRREIEEQGYAEMAANPDIDPDERAAAVRRRRATRRAHETEADGAVDDEASAAEPEAEISEEPEEPTDELGQVEQLGDVPLVSSAAAEETANEVDETEEAEKVETPATLLETGHPVIRILRPTVDIIGASAAAPTSATHLAVCTRIATYIALNPGSSRPSMVHAVWGGRRVSANTVNPRVSNLRKWLGVDPETEEQYLPAGRLEFAETVATDWDIFTRLVGAKPAKAPTEALEKALSLVESRPLEGEGKEYAFTEYDQIHIDDTIVDVAYELAKRRYFEGAWSKAIAAASRGVLIDPCSERLWRIWISAEYDAGHPERVAQAIERMRARICEIDPDSTEDAEFEPETTLLLAGIAQHDPEKIAQSRKAL